MRKFFILAISFFAPALLSSNALASGQHGDSGSITLGSGSNSVEVKLSSNVEANYYSASGDKYSADTFNDKGTQEYGTASDTSYIYYKDTTALDSLTVGDSGDVNSWTPIGGTSSSAASGTSGG